MGPQALEACLTTRTTRRCGPWSRSRLTTGHCPTSRFIEDLSDFKYVALEAALGRVLAVRGLGLVRTEWLKALGEGLHEFRVRHDAEEIAHMFGGDVPTGAGAPETVLLRVFVHFHGAKVIVLLGGYDKGDEPSERRQQREIREARRLLAQFKERQRRQRASAAKPAKWRRGKRRG